MKILFLYFDVARQVSDPVQLIMEKIYYNANDNYCCANEYDVFSNFRIHVNQNKRKQLL